MPFKKGHKKTGGKVKGIEHEVTKDVRSAFKDLIDGELDSLKDTLERVKAKSPKDYFKIITDLSEYVLPKLNRTEIVNEQEQEHTIIIIGGKEFKI